MTRTTSLALILLLTSWSAACGPRTVSPDDPSNAPPESAERDKTVYKVAVNPDLDPIRGDHRAPVTVVAFTDLQCAYCSQTSALLKEMVETRQNEVRWVLKHLPLPNHELAMPAAASVICAKEQGREWEVHDAVSAKNGELDGNGLYETIVAELSDMPAWEQCMESQAMNDKLLADLELGMLVEVTGTPTLFINGRRVEGMVSREMLQERINEALQEARDALERGVPREELYARLIENGKINDFLGPRTHRFSVKESHRLGSAEAPVTLMLFSDYECPYCVQAAPMLEAAQAHFGDRVSLVYKHFPLTFHPRAAPAARASICAGEQGQFWPYHHALLDDLQRGAMEASPLTDEALEKTAADLGIDLAAFSACLAS
ncbi:MAG: thioredoxin domain-containing protein, partial [Myxococcota bacterium]|nr:thioredoxin domain-containing protein [Myxococcota bacterium]